MPIPTWRENPLFTAMLFLVSLTLVLFLGAKAHQTVIQTGRPSPLEHTIYVEGVGKTTMIPDIAVMTFGVSTQQKTVADAQKENSKIMNAMIE